MCRLLIRSIDQSDVKLVLGVDPKPFPIGKSLLIFLRQQLILLKCAQMRFNALIKQNIGDSLRNIENSSKNENDCEIERL